MLDTATAAHLASCLVFLFFFSVLLRHDPRPYLRHWTAAWAAEALALAAVLFSSGGSAAVPAYVLGQTAHGLLVVSGAWSFSRGPLSATTFRGAAAAVVIATLLVPYLGSGPPLQGLVHALLAVAYLGSAVLLWPLREPTGSGLRTAVDALALLALRSAVAAVLPFAPAAPGFLTAAQPVLALALQTVFAMAVALAVMEAAQWALTATHEQLKEAQHRLKVLGETDALTGCFNRQVFREMVDDLRSGGRGQHGVVLLLDLQGFRALNEREGHAAGDDALRRAAEAIRSRTRTTDVVVRWGGDEFVLVLQGVGRAEAEARRKEIDEALVREGLSASSGLGAYGPAVDIMAAVDEAEKEQGQAGGERRRAGG